MGTAAVLALIGGIVGAGGTITAGLMQKKAVGEARDASLEQAETIRKDMKEQQKEKRKAEKERFQIGMQQNLFERMKLSKQMKNQHLRNVGMNIMSMSGANMQWRRAMQEVYKARKAA